MTGGAIRFYSVQSSHGARRSGGFTIVELIVVLILTAILGAIGAARFFDRRTADTASFAEQTRSMLRYAQLAAIAQHRPVYVRIDAGAIALCFDSALPCKQDRIVISPAGSNSGDSVTRAACRADVGGGTLAYAPTWHCAGKPDTLSLSATTFPVTLHFDRLGRSYLDGVADFAAFQITVRASDNSNPVLINVAPETGYVY